MTFQAVFATNMSRERGTASDSSGWSNKSASLKTGQALAAFEAKRDLARHRASERGLRYSARHVTIASLLDQHQTRRCSPRSHPRVQAETAGGWGWGGGGVAGACV
eukprot:5785232-Pleurochrysis_carterae.AAC.1